ncbi:MAG: hypothetical protein PCFJNLEI_00807 [Verrucomicrobiae bacterium]|nr:hypothetical protein [Verrucomicrobiae bacterium]
MIWSLRSLERAAGVELGVPHTRLPLSQSSPNSRGFTLIELLAVVLVVLVLAAIGLGVAGYVQKKVAIATTKSQIAAIEAALESYKSDWGYYPLTTPQRISTDNSAELTNNAILYRALFEHGKRYLTFPAAQLHSELNVTYSTGTNIFDIYGRPFNYYCSPTTAFGMTNRPPVASVNTYIVTNKVTFGGQVNVATYDLFSYGPDRLTYWGTNTIFTTAYTTYQPQGINWHDPKSALDDLTNWNP